MSFKVLVCDDSALARKQVIKSLNACLDAEIQQAGDGSEALSMLERHIFDLVCLDLTMPKLDGVAVLEAIKRAHLECFVLVISADIQAAMQQRVADLGAIDFIKKPVSETRLREVLHKFGVY